MKQGWEIKKLGEVCDFQGGSQPPKDEWIKEPMNGYVRMLQIRDFTLSCNFDIEYVKLSNKLRLCKSDDILIGRYGASVGKVLTGLSGAYNVAIIKSIPNEKIIAKPYIRRYFESELFQSHLDKICRQRAAQAGFSKEDIEDLALAVPPIAEQERIVEVLDREFERIDAMKANAEQNLQHAKDLFQAALRQELQPKDGWEQHLLADVCEYKKEQGYYTHLPFVGMENIESGTGKLIGCQNGEKILSTTFRFQKGFVMYGRLRPYLKKVFVADFEGCCSTEIFPIVVNGVLPNLLMYWFLSDFTTDKINATCGGCRMPRANMNVVKQFYIWLPLLEEQEQIVARLDNLNERCKALEENHKKTIALCDDMKQALLRKAFNGEL